MSTSLSKPGTFRKWTNSALIERFHNIQADVESSKSAQPVLELFELMLRDIGDVEVGRLMFEEEYTHFFIDLIAPYDLGGEALVRLGLYQRQALHDIQSERERAGSWGQSFSTYDDLSKIPFELKTQEDLFIAALLKKTPEKIARALVCEENYVPIFHTFQRAFPDKMIPMLLALDTPALWPVIEDVVVYQGYAGLSIAADIKRKIDGGEIERISLENIKTLAEKIYTEQLSDVSRLLTSLEREDVSQTTHLQKSFTVAHDEGLINPDIMAVLDQIVQEVSLRRLENERRKKVLADIGDQMPEAEQSPRIP